MPLELPSSVNSTDISLKKYDRVILVGMALLGLSVVGTGVWGLILILPTLLEAAKNGILLIIMLFVIVFLVIELFNIFLNLPNYVLKMKMGAQALRRKYISGNPIAAIDVSIASMQERYDKACKLAIEADGATKHLKQKIHADDRKSGAADKADNEDRLAQAAQNTHRSDSEINEHLVKAERAHRTVDTLQPLVDRQEERQKKVEAARDYAKSQIADLCDRKENLSIVLDAYQADAKQSRALSAFFGARSKEMATIEIAVDEIVRQSAQAEAEIEQMLHDADPLIQEAQLQREADALHARERLDASTAQKRLAEPPPLRSLPIVKDITDVKVERK
jgi:chromosome segregation ATPase